MEDHLHPATERPEALADRPQAAASRALRIPLSRPLVVWIVLAANVVMWLLMTLAGGSENSEVLIRFGAKVNTLIAVGEYWRLITPIFLHVGIMHLAFNSYALFAIGPEVERIFGHIWFLLLYLVAGFGGVVASFTFNDHLSAGASGAIFGLVGALAVFFLRYRDAFGGAGRRQFGNIVAIIALNLAFGFFYPGIDNHGHLGGLLTGIVLGWVLLPKYGLVRTWDGIPVRVEDRQSDGRRLALTAVVAIVLILGAALAIRAQSGSLLARLERGDRLLTAGNLDAALVEFEAAAQAAPDSPHAQFMAGYVLSEQEDFEGAVAAFEQAVSLKQDWAEARWNLALAYTFTERYQDAMREIEVYMTLPIGAAEQQRAAALLDRLEAVSDGTVGR